MAEAAQAKEMPHTVILEERERLRISGVLDVECFDELSVRLATVRGPLQIHGEGLHIEQLQLDCGELAVTGAVTQLLYEEEPEPRVGLWARLFG